MPLAVYLGHNYGRKGIATVVIGGLLLPVGFSFGPLAFPSEPAVYVIAILLAVIVGTGRAISRIFMPLHFSWPFVAAFVLLPFSGGFYEYQINDLHVYLGLDLLPLFFFLLFLFGVTNTGQRLVIGTLAIATVVGFIMEVAYRYGLVTKWIAPIIDGNGFLSDLRLKYALDEPVYFLTGVSYYLLGRYLVTIDKPEPASTEHFYLRAAGLGFLLLLWGGCVAYCVPPRLIGTAYALPLAAFFAGLAFRFEGIAVAVAFSVYLLSLEAITRASDILPRHYPVMNLHQALYCFAYGVLGLRVGDRARGIKTSWPFGWLAYTGLLLMTIPFLFELEEVKGGLLALAALIALIGLSLLATKIRRLAGEPANLTSASGWIAFAGLVLFVLTFLTNIQASFDLMVETFSAAKGVVRFFFGAGKTWEPTDAFLLATASLLYLAVILTALAKFVIALPALSDEFVRIAALMQTFLVKIPLIGAILGVSEKSIEAPNQMGHQKNERTPSRRYLLAITTLFTWARNLVIVAALIMIAFAIMTSL